MQTFKEYLMAEGQFPGSPQRGSELRAAAAAPTAVRAKRNVKNLPDERTMYHGRTEKDKKGNKRTYKGKQWEKNL